MKKVFLLIAAILFLFACKQDKPAPSKETISRRDLAAYLADTSFISFQSNLNDAAAIMANPSFNWSHITDAKTALDGAGLPINTNNLVSKLNSSGHLLEAEYIYKNSKMSWDLGRFRAHFIEFDTFSNEHMAQFANSIRIATSMNPDSLR